MARVPINFSDPLRCTQAQSLEFQRRRFFQVVIAVKFSKSFFREDKKTKSQSSR
jgi:hypothetical protein